MPGDWAASGDRRWTKLLQCTWWGPHPGITRLEWPLGVCLLQHGSAPSIPLAALSQFEMSVPFVTNGQCRPGIPSAP